MFFFKKTPTRITTGFGRTPLFFRNKNFLVARALSESKSLPSAADAVPPLVRAVAAAFEEPFALNVGRMGGNRLSEMYPRPLERGLWTRVSEPFVNANGRFPSVAGDVQTFEAY